MVVENLPSDFKSNAVFHILFSLVFMHTQQTIGKLYKLKFGSLKSSWLTSLLILGKKKQDKCLHY